MDLTPLRKIKCAVAAYCLARKQSKLLLKTSMKAIDAIITRGIPLTVRAYISWNWMGDKTLQTLEAEERVEVLDLIEDGLLVDTESNQNQLSIETCLTPECPNWIRPPKPPSLYFISDKTQHEQFARQCSQRTRPDPPQLTGCFILSVRGLFESWRSHSYRRVNNK
jgi:hypothetical protein